MTAHDTEGSAQAATAEPPGVRLQKVLAAAGVGSRRYCERLIASGRVSVDGAIVQEQGMRVDPQSAVVRVDGARIPTADDTVVFMLNKPRGMLTTMSDPAGRPCVGDAVAELDVRLFHVGRLDGDSEGLLLLTNDGELAHNLMHPSRGVAKTYVAWVPGPVRSATLHTLRAGVRVDDREVAVESVRVLERDGDRVLVEVVIHEGRKHIVRRLLAAVGHPVVRLVRTRIGPLPLGSLPPGQLRVLTAQERRDLYAAADPQRG